MLSWALALFLSVQAIACAQTVAAIDIRVQPLRGFDLRDPSRQQFGELFFRGGLVLQSSFRHFGGLSAIRMAADGEHFISLTDKGWWLRGRLQYEGKRPGRITEAEMAPILGPTGSPLAARGWYDTEAIAEDGGTLYVGMTNDLVRRVFQHRNGMVPGFTKRYGVKRLVYFEEHATAVAAIQREKNIKHWSREWKIDLIVSMNPEWRDLYDEIAV